MDTDKDKRKPQGRLRDRSQSKTTPTATNSEAREKQLISLAMDVAEKQMRDGTATSQVITHFLKLGSETEKLQRDKLRNEVELLKAKVVQIESQARMEELYAQAITAMNKYTGQDVQLELGDGYDDPEDL